MPDRSTAKPTKNLLALAAAVVALTALVALWPDGLLAQEAGGYRGYREYGDFPLIGSRAAKDSGCHPCCS